MINAVAKGVAFDLLVNRKWAMMLIVMELHLWGVKTGFALYEIANGGVFDNHFGPKRIAWETEKIIALIGSNLYDNICPAGEDVLGMLDFGIWKSLLYNIIQRI